jgi:hypothetical protein
MGISIIDPLSDGRWDAFAASHPDASAFHTRGWLGALARTYGYQPVALTSSEAGDIENGLVFCRVESRLTGKRLVSLPFTDHCEPLLAHSDDWDRFALWLKRACDTEGWRYAELRALSSREGGDDAWKPGCSYCFHTLDLTPTLDYIFRGFHRDSLQRRIRHAEGLRLTYETGRQERLLREFYSLMCRTRRRHGVFPQPLAWFRNILVCMGDRVQIRVMRKDSFAVASMLTFHHRSQVIYKYGCSDERFHHLGAMPFLFWQLIQESKAEGMSEIDFGRSDADQKSLILFKDRFGTRKQILTYRRYSPASAANNGTGKVREWSTRATKQIVHSLPESILRGMGRILYRHIG